jgi:hypothetical protein
MWVASARDWPCPEHQIPDPITDEIEITGRGTAASGRRTDKAAIMTPAARSGPARPSSRCPRHAGKRARMRPTASLRVGRARADRHRVTYGAGAVVMSEVSLTMRAVVQGEVPSWPRQFAAPARRVRAGSQAPPSPTRGGTRQRSNVVRQRLQAGARQRPCSLFAPLCWGDGHHAIIAVGGPQTRPARAPLAPPRSNRARTRGPIGPAPRLRPRT